MSVCVFLLLCCFLPAASADILEVTVPDARETLIFDTDAQRMYFSRQTGNKEGYAFSRFERTENELRIEVEDRYECDLLRSRRNVRQKISLHISGDAGTLELESDRGQGVFRMQRHVDIRKK